MRSISYVAKALVATYGWAVNNVRELIVQGVVEEVEGANPKLIRFPEALAALQVSHLRN